MKIILLTFVLLVGCSTPRKKNIEVTKNQITIKEYDIQPGEVIRLNLSAVSYDVDLYCGNTKIPFAKGEDSNFSYWAESYFTKMKPYTCSYKSRSKGNEVVARIKVVERKFSQEKLYVDKKRITLSKKDQARAIKEHKFLKKIYSGYLKIPLFKENFKRPLNSKITSYYGTRRIYNNQKKSQHLGMDYKAPVGLPILSSNSGKVVVSRHLFYTGNTVIIDHGLGIFTVYAHLSKLIADEGEFLPKNVLLGHAGKTGRVTGPHLHWGVKVHGNWIDGHTLVKATSERSE
jgi:murein DD-endopeptidase MepM/ murein hydrolase activator NlpD